MRRSAYTLEFRNLRTQQWVRLREDVFASASDAILFGLMMFSSVQAEWRWCVI